jgi:hypothetical protein
MLIRGMDMTQDNGMGAAAITSNNDFNKYQVEEDDIEESIKEEILESQGNSNQPNTAHGTKHGAFNTNAKRDSNAGRESNNPFSNKNNSNAKAGALSNATPNTILSNKQKLNRGVSRDSEYNQYNLNNGTMLNFGLAGQSTRSTFMKTPLMFGQNAHAKLRDIKAGHGQTSLYSNGGGAGGNTFNNIYSPQSGFNRNFAL